MSVVPGVVHRIRSKPSGPSWTALVAEAAGLGQLDVVELEVKGTLDPGKEYRLVAHRLTRRGGGRPVASAQLSVTASAVAAGVVLRLYSTKSMAARDTQVLVWIEQGPASLEFDGLQAKPDHAEFAGRCRVEGGRARALLKRVVPAPCDDDAHADAA